MTLFDATLFTGSPANGHPGTDGRLRVLYPSDIWSGGQDQTQLPDEATFKSIIVAVTQDRLCLDIEPSPHWTFEEQLARFPTLLRWAREAKPSLNIGYYGIEREWYAPLNYWKARTSSRIAAFDSWKAEFTSMASAASVDASYPSVYQLVHPFVNDDFDGYAYWNIQNYQTEFRKPIFPFAWWQYHDSIADPNGNTYLGDANWYHVVFRATLLTGNCVLWGGYDPDAAAFLPYDASAEAILNIAVNAYGDASAIRSQWDDAGPQNYVSNAP